MPVLRKSLGLSGIAVLALTGCIPAGEPPIETPRPVASGETAPPSESAEPKPAADECGAGKLGGYLGQLPASDATAKIRQTVGHDRIRTIKRGDAVTMDYRPDRLNIETGEDGRIERVHCG